MRRYLVETNLGSSLSVVPLLRLAIGVCFAFATIARYRPAGGRLGLACVLIFASITGLGWYVHHIRRLLRMSALIDFLGDEARDRREILYPTEALKEPAPWIELRHGVGATQTALASRGNA
jgi:hypothetical protein